MIARSPRSVIFTTHAEERIVERSVDRPTLLAMLASPTLKGPAEAGARWASGSVMVAMHRAWLTAIYVEDGEDLVVLTTYLGPPSRARTTDALRAATKGPR